jgi:hypothetical protein
VARSAGHAPSSSLHFAADTLAVTVDTLRVAGDTLRVRTDEAVEVAPRFVVTPAGGQSAPDGIKSESDKSMV